MTSNYGGAYIPPAKLRALQAAITDKSSVEYQRLSWEALKKSIHGLVNKVNTSNITNVVRELFNENIIRGRGLLVRSIMQAQQFSPTFTNVYAALIAIINTKFPQIGELTLKRLMFQFKTSYRQNKKDVCLALCMFIAHLVNQNVSHEILCLQILTLLLENPTNHSVEISIGLLKECGKKLQEESPKSLHAIFETLRNILHQNVVDTRIQYMIEVMFAVRKDGFKDYPRVIKELDLVEEDDQYTHLLSIEEESLQIDNQLNIFKVDEQFLENENKYKILKREILDESSSDDDDDDDDDDVDGTNYVNDNDDDDDLNDDNEKNDDDEKEQQMIIDETETNLVTLRRTIYLTIQSSLDFQECAHKLLKMNLKKSQEIELCQMILDSCAQQRTFERFFGLLGQRFCQLRNDFVEYFEKIFKEQYDTIHRLETVKLRNVSKFFAHLFYTDAISWGALECIHLNEDETTSSSRVFIKNLFLELSENMGIVKLRDRLSDVTLQEFYQGLFPRDNPRNTRFSINFFTSIGLGALTDDLREHLKSMPKVIQPPVVLDALSDAQIEIKQEPKDVPKKKMKKQKSDSSSTSTSSSSSSDSSSSESSTSNSTNNSDNDDDQDLKNNKRKKSKKLNKKVDVVVKEEPVERDDREMIRNRDDYLKRRDYTSKRREYKRHEERRPMNDYNRSRHHKERKRHSKDRNDKRRHHSSTSSNESDDHDYDKNYQQQRSKHIKNSK